MTNEQPFTHRRRVQHPGGGESKTKQADAAATDINVLVRRWMQHGVVPGNASAPQYGDFSSGLTYHESLERVRAAQADFNALPAPVRRLCANDVGNFLDLVSTTEGLKTLVEVGFAPELAEHFKPVEQPELETPQEDQNTE